MAKKIRVVTAVDSQLKILRYVVDTVMVKVVENEYIDTRKVSAWISITDISRHASLTLGYSQPHLNRIVTYIGPTLPVSLYLHLYLYLKARFILRLCYTRDHGAGYACN